MTEPPRVTILCAVSEIREFHAEDAFLMAVAAWLEHSAESIGLNRSPYVDQHLDHALATAQAFLEKP